MAILFHLIKMNRDVLEQVYIFVIKKSYAGRLIYNFSLKTIKIFLVPFSVVYLLVKPTFCCRHVARAAANASRKELLKRPAASGIRGR